MQTPRSGASRLMAQLSALAAPRLVGLVGVVGVLGLVGCGSSQGRSSGPGEEAAAAALSTRSLGALAQETRALPGAAQGPAAANAGSFVLLCGGASPQESATIHVTELELSSGQTRPRPDALVIPRSGHILHLTPAGEWFALGGVDAAGRPLDSVERYDALGARWVLAPLTLPLAGRLTSARSDRFLVVAAGGSARVEFLDALSLAPSGTLFLEGTPREAPPLLHLAGRNEAIFVGGDFPCFFDAVTRDGYSFPASWLPLGAAVLPVGDLGVLFFGGRDAEGRALTQAHYFELGTFELVPLGPQLPPIEGAAAAWLADGSVLLAGGSWEGRLSERALRIDLGGQIQTLEPLGEARDSIRVVSDGLRVALVGGRAEAGPSALVDLFGFSELAPTQAFAEAAARRQQTIETIRSTEEVRAAREAAEAGEQELIREVALTQGRLDQAAGERDRLRRELQEAEVSRLRVESQVASLAGQAQALTRAIQRLDQASAQDRARASQLQREQALVAQDLAAAQAEQARQSARATSLSGQLGQAQSEVAAQQQAITDLEAESARRAAAQPAPTPVVGVPVSTPPAGVAAQPGNSGLPAPVRMPTSAPAPTRPGNASPAPTPNAQLFQAGGVYSWASVLARLNGAAQ